MFDEVIVAVDDDEAALDALALGKALASPVAALTLAHVEADGAERAGVDPWPAHDTQPPRPLLELSDGNGGAGAIIEDAPCAVAVAPAGYAGRTPRLDTIGVGYDGSLASEQALEAARRLAALGDVEPHAEYGGRAEELARFGASVDLPVIGPRDQDGESALHLAPLALRLAHHAPCPVLVVAKPAPVASDGR